MITQAALIQKFRFALTEKWGYIWGTAGEVWTQSKQNGLVQEFIKDFGTGWKDNDKAKKKDKKIIVMLDGIEDPHNLGAILRSADVFEASGIILPKHNSVSLNATVAKTSAGAINYVPVAIVNNLNQAIATLKNEGYWIVSTDGSATIDYSSIKYEFPVVVVIGSEGKGVSSLVLKNSDYIVKIPQFGHVNSLNASVAAGILLAEVHKSNI